MRYRSLLLASALMVQTFAPSFAAAQTSELNRPSSIRINVQNGMPAVGDFTVGPARMLLSMDPGEERTVQIELTNREGRLAAYDLTTEDFASDPDRQGTPMFFAEHLDGPFPAREWITPQVPRLELRHAERAYLTVTIKVPKDAEPGDHQAALIVTRDKDSQPVGGFQIVSRVAAMFVISVKGDIIKEGYVDRLWADHFFNWFFPVRLTLSARNSGTVYMIPTGVVRIKNIFGITVDEIPLRDWVVLRDSTRTRTFDWHPRFALGYYKASTDLKVYDEQRVLDPVSTSFIVIPLLPVLIILLVIFLVSFLVQYFSARFEIRRKEPEEKKDDQ